MYTWTFQNRIFTVFKEVICYAGGGRCRLCARATKRRSRGGGGHAVLRGTAARAAGTRAQLPRRAARRAARTRGPTISRARTPYGRPIRATGNCDLY